MDVFGMATKRALEGTEGSGPPALPLPQDYTSEGRFYDLRSEKFTNVIAAHLSAAFEDLKGKVIDKGDYRYKVTVTSEEGESVVFTSQVFFDRVNNNLVITIDRRGGALTSFQKVYQALHENMGDILI